MVNTEGLFIASTASNQRGGSIIEVVVMSGVMMAMLTGFMSLMNHESQNVTYLEDKLSRVALESELRMQFAGSEYCEDLFQGVVAPKVKETKNVTKNLTQTAQLAALQQIFQKRSNQYFYDKLVIKNINMEASTLTAPNSSGTISLLFYPERVRKGGGPPDLQPIKIKTAVSVDAGYKIKSCSAEGEEGQGKSCKTDDLDLTSIPHRIWMMGACTVHGGGRGETHTVKQQMRAKLNSTKIISGKGQNTLHGAFALVKADWSEKRTCTVRHTHFFQVQCNNGEWMWVGASNLDSAVRGEEVQNMLGDPIVY